MNKNTEKFIATKARLFNELDEIYRTACPHCCSDNPAEYLMRRKDWLNGGRERLWRQFVARENGR